MGQMEQLMAINVNYRWLVVNNRDIYLYRLRVAVIVFFFFFFFFDSVLRPFQAFSLISRRINW